MAPTTNVFITGVSRGLGKALAATYLSRPNHLVIGSVRDLAAAKELDSLPVAEGSKLSLVKIEVTKSTDFADAVKKIQGEGVEKLDLVIANAGISGKIGGVAAAQLDDVREVFEVNVVGVVALFQATLPLLTKSESPKWVSIGTISGTIGGMEQIAAFPTVPYGISKAGLNFATRAIHFNHPNLTAFVIHPGWVKTDMGNGNAKAFGLAEAFHNIDDSIKGVVKIINGATREETSGKFIDFEGASVAW
ncbi:Norsolorinic acid ketoreductase nor1 [Cladobotryum mycophilum]|uniref:Norsolorinic acid ketoreductase nor1 n=1 Tax=Cladobotryum mycophilum TaxID=491253 RepID=A0ABR0SIM8_9HYPO